MSNYDDLVGFLTREAGVKREECALEADLETDLGITGVEGCELITAYGKQFGVGVGHLVLDEYFHDEPSLFSTARVIKPLRVHDLLMGIENGVLNPVP